MSEHTESGTDYRGPSAMPTNSQGPPETGHGRTDSMSSSPSSKQASDQSPAGKRSSRARRSHSSIRYNSPAPDQSMPEHLRWYRVIEIPFTIRCKRIMLPFSQHRNDPTTRSEYVYHIIENERLIGMLAHRNRDLWATNLLAEGEVVSSGRPDTPSVLRYLLPRCMSPQMKLEDHRARLRAVLKMCGVKKRLVNPGKLVARKHFIPGVEHARDVAPHFWRARAFAGRRGHISRTIRFERIFCMKGYNGEQTDEAMEWLDARVTQIDPRRPQGWKLVGSQHWVEIGTLPPDFRRGSPLRNDWKP